MTIVQGTSQPVFAATDDVILQAEDLVKWYPIRRGMTGAAAGVVHAVDGISFTVRAGQTLALVGESGCGKSTTARMLASLIEPTSGRVTFGDKDLGSLSVRELRRIREQVQIVFQDPFASLNPKMKAADIVAEPLRAHGRYSKERVRELFDMVKLDFRFADRRPHEFSGGQRQRLNIARALALDP